MVRSTFCAKTSGGMPLAVVSAITLFGVPSPLKALMVTLVRTNPGQMMVTGADDATMDVECTECGDGHTVEPDFFHDGGVIYWPQAMAALEEEEL